MASMSYCLFENLATLMSQALDALEDVDDVRDMDHSEYERRAILHVQEMALHLSQSLNEKIKA